MGFYRVEEIVDAFKKGNLDIVLADYSVNDLALLRHEVVGYAEKKDLLGDMDALVEELEFLIDTRRAAESK
jgi:hypothetical protein